MKMTNLCDDCIHAMVRAKMSAGMILSVYCNKTSTIATIPRDPGVVVQVQADRARPFAK